MAAIDAGLDVLAEVRARPGIDSQHRRLPKWIRGRRDRLLGDALLLGGGTHELAYHRRGILAHGGRAMLVMEQAVVLSHICGTRRRRGAQAPRCSRCFGA
jgi:hypothetical protein